MSTTKGRTTTKTRTVRAASDTVTCAVYVRISQDVSGDEHGVQNQQPLATTKARALGWHVPEWAVYVDNDKSASKANVVREEYERMLADIQAGRVQAIVVVWADRLYRRNKELERLVEIVEAHGVAIRTVYSGDIDLTTAGGRLHARILGSVAMHEGEIKAERVKLAYTRNRKDGRMPGGKRMFGWTTSGELVESEAAVVREAAQRILAGTRVTTLCKELDARGVRTTQGNPWQVTAFTKLLKNPRVAGLSMLHGELVGEGEWPAILERDTWDTLVAVLASRSKARTRAPRVALLPGLATCGVCGAGLTTGRRGPRTPGAASQRTYVCPVTPGLGGHGCISVDAEAVELIVEEFARERLSDPRVREHLERAHKATSSHTSQELTRKRARLVELEAAMEDEDEDLTSLRKAARTVRAKIAELEEQLVGEVRAQHRVALPDVDAAWPTDLESRRALVELVVQGVAVNAGGGGGRFRAERVQIEPVPM